MRGVVPPVVTPLKTDHTLDVPAFERLLGNPRWAAQLASAGRDLVRTTHTAEQTAARTEAVYLEAAARRG